jgi:hypothetical protein
LIRQLELKVPTKAPTHEVGVKREIIRKSQSLYDLRVLATARIKAGEYSLAKDALQKWKFKSASEAIVQENWIYKEFEEDRLNIRLILAELFRHNGQLYEAEGTLTEVSSRLRRTEIATWRIARSGGCIQAGTGFVWATGGNVC